ncbi:hypothetical protein S40288_06666 [Stachybotrys chartarum IBT 40288]|nr:hypothetical protein S40288_06666 [Stachybotrys chartarum IBT 40288]
MAYTSYHEAQALPRIIASGPDHYRGHHHQHPRDLPMSSSPAMIIPGSESHTEVPPPLPPPQFPFGHAPHPTHSAHPQPHFHSPRHHPRDMHREPRFGYTPSSAASNYGSLADEPSSYRRREFDHQDEGYASVSTDRSRDSLHAGFGLHHNKFHFHSPADIHVDSLKQKLNPIRTHDKSPPRSLLSSSERPARANYEARVLPQLSMPVQLPFRSMVDSPARSNDTPIYSAMSPVTGPFQHGPPDFHSYSDASDLDRSPRQRRRNNSDDATSTQGSFEYNGAEDMEIDDASSQKRQRNEDAYSSGGLKRRAPSPADELMVHGLGHQGDLLRRREGTSRGSPTPRLTTVPQGSSISSMSSVSRSNSYMSTASMAPSSITTANSYGRRSPGGLSPGGISPTSCNSPYNAPMSLNPSPRTSISGRAAAQHSRTVSGASPRKLAEMPKPGGSKLQKFFMCECCPKKPKKFETAEELSTHEAEKQYECSYCGNRFKNKNEAERHQNSLHVRRHSWSCSALLGYGRAFHDSTNRPGEADTCGYCGDDFPRTGRGPGSSALGGTSSTGMAHRHATDQDWDERIRHLQEVHKFRECNSSKKFYRADHFRQHLKHSHAGTSGKWTNMLENACMLEEDPTPRLRRPASTPGEQTADPAVGARATVAKDIPSEAAVAAVAVDQVEERLSQWDDYGHEYKPGELEELKMSIVEMALSRVQGQDELYIGGLWALRRSDALRARGITHVLSVVGFNPSSLKNFKDEPWTQYGSGFKHMVVDVDDVEDADLLVELPRAVRFIDQGLKAASHPPEVDQARVLEKNMDKMELGEMDPDAATETTGGVFVHCMAGKSRSATVIIAYLLWRHPNRFDPGTARPRKETAKDAVRAALAFVRRNRPMVEPNPGFMEQLALWWEMDCPADADEAVETHPVYQRWAYRREVEENVAVGMAPTNLRFEDEQRQPREGDGDQDAGLSLRCKKCRRTLATNAFIVDHKPAKPSSSGGAAPPCQHFFIEPLSWMRGELEKGSLNGRLLCANPRCGAAVGRYDWKGFRCSCAAWVTPAFSLQRARVDDVVVPPQSPPGASGAGSRQGMLRSMGIRMPPGPSREGNL